MSDDALIEAMARAIVGVYLTDNCENAWREFTDEAKAALAVARPIIEAQERDECWRIVMQWAESSDTAVDIAAALKETGDE